LDKEVRSNASRLAREHENPSESSTKTQFESAEKHSGYEPLGIHK
jgi:hypothetical protein